jgi:hypothetical protein
MTPTLPSPAAPPTQSAPASSPVPPAAGTPPAPPPPAKPLGTLWEWAGIALSGVAVLLVAGMVCVATPLGGWLARTHRLLPYVVPLAAGLLASGRVALDAPMVVRFMKISMVLGALSWTRNAFSRGWMISGETGSGKTEFLKMMMHSLCVHECGVKNAQGGYDRGSAPWGGLCIDEKSFFKDEVLPILDNYGRKDDVYVLETRADDAPPDWRPKFYFNILGDDRVATAQYVDAIVRTASSVAGGKEDKGFFKTQAGLHIGAAIDLFRGIRRAQQRAKVERAEWVAPTLKGVYEVLSTVDDYHALLKRVGLMEERPEVTLTPSPNGTVTKETKKKLVITFVRLDDPLLRKSIDHFQKRFWNVKAQEQMEGVKGTITNYLHWFTDEDICDVFCRQDATFNIDVMDLGKIVCLSMPQRYAIQRRYLCALMKLLAYAHGLSRNPIKYKYNLLVIWQDEAQRFVQEADSNVDVMRQFQMTTVMSTQSKVSLYVPMGGRDQAQPILINLRNRVILRAADEECAEESAKYIGKVLRKKITKTVGANGGTSHNISEEVQYRYEPYQIRTMPDFTAIVCRAGGGRRVYEFAPMDGEGKTPAWYPALASSGMRRRLPWIERGWATRFRPVRLRKPTDF